MNNIGAMVVVSTDGVVGIVSERDVVRKLHEHGAELLRLPVSADHDDDGRDVRADDTVDHLDRADDRPSASGTSRCWRTASWSGSSASATSSRQRMEELETEQRALQDYITRG